jgi:protein-S-isoprenylcysteine O-methyltransferase Ste14
MSQSRNAYATAAFFIAAPGVVAGFVPWLITGWEVPSVTPYFAGLIIGLGGFFIVGGVAVLIDCFVRFVTYGNGTPMPWMPTDRMVASGAYRYVRNPMYVAVVAIIFGQAILFANIWLVPYGAGVWLVFHYFVVQLEEPDLRRSFGSLYADYVALVPRWLPRIAPPPKKA